MPNETLSQLRAQKEDAERKLAQAQHKLNLLENRIHYKQKKERAQRTHHLCNIGGTVESLAPVFKELTKTELMVLLENIFGLPSVQDLVRQMAETHKQNAETEKELMSDGSVSF